MAASEGLIRPQSGQDTDVVNVGFPDRPLASRTAELVKVFLLVKVFGCRQAYENLHQARTRGAAATVYGDFEFCLVEVMAKPARRWSRRGLGA